MIKLLLALLVLCAGIAAAFVDPKNKRGKKIILTILFGLFIATLVDNHQTQSDVEARQKQIDGLTTTNAVLTKGSAELEARAADLKQLIINLQTDLTKKLSDLSDQLTLLTSRGFSTAEAKSATVDDAIASNTADAAYNRARAAWISDGEKPSPTSLKYYFKGIDPTNLNIILKALRDVGFNAVPGTSLLPKNETNTIYAGELVKVEDVKRVAFTLMRAGFKIRQICQFNPNGNHPEYRTRNLIHVGADTSVTEKDPVLTVRYVEGLKEIGEKLHPQPAKPSK